MANDRGFQSIRRPSRNEDALLEALAARKGVGRLQSPPEPSTEPPEARADPSPSPQQEAEQRPWPTEEGQGGPPTVNGHTTPQPTRPRTRAMNLVLPDYVMQQLKERALREDCSVRHVIMQALVAQGITIHESDMIADGRRIRGKHAPQ